MTTPVNIGQPAMAMPYYVIGLGAYPGFEGSGAFGIGSSQGFVVTTAFDVRLSYAPNLYDANGQVISVASNRTLYSLLGNTYGAEARESFSLPDLQGAAPVYLSTSGGQTRLGITQGTPENSVLLSQEQLPTTLGGTMAPINNSQYGLGLQYMIQVEGIFPVGSEPMYNTIGMVYPFAAVVERGVPDGFLPADGRLLDIASYPALYAALGTAYGGNGISTFALPDLRNRVPIGTGRTETGQYIAVGQELGVAPLSLLQPDIAGDSAVSVMQPSLGMNYVIILEGPYGTFNEGKPMMAQVLLYAGAHIPDEWTFAKGQMIEITDDTSSLYSLLGTRFGGDGVTTFALPDLQGRTIVGTGGVNNLQIGDTQGSFSEYITAANLPEIVTPVPGVQVLDENGQVAGDKITGKFELDVSGVWPQARVEYSTDGTTWSETFTAQEGTNTLYLRQVNVLGQASAATRAITFVLDTTAPEAPEVVIDGVAVAAPAFKAAVPADSNDTIPRTSTGKLSFGKVEDGAILEFSIDGGQTWSDTFEAQPGLNQVQVRQVDMAGNVSPASELIQFYWDGSDTEAAVTSTTTHSTGGNVITVEQHGALATGLGTDSIDLLIHGHQQDVTLPDDIEHIRLTENGLNNTVSGNAQDNVFEVIVGNWVIEGSGGQDTVKLSNALADYVITQESHNGQLNGQLQATLYGPEGRIIVRDVETIEFSDVTLLKTDGTDITEIDHLYEEVLGRSPDAEGLTYWVEQMNQGATLQDVAQALAESTEFKQLYGTPSEEQLVEELYEAILDRSPDAQGLAYWTEALVVHGATEGELIVSLLTSAESQSASMHQAGAIGLFVLG
ncbi:tail fiber protein [Orrella daihaiensis]|uniref:Tail fiber protein n=1 Tax=Orrella daihaiensis TaxID=2782176 RepID=A0ABY4AMU5_9BURK|nr:tail fiber protein [Orrella daihaiensis]UOD50392.1 tail fiber protein [Orrella daihaiensis]